MRIDLQNSPAKPTLMRSVGSVAGATIMPLKAAAFILSHPALWALCILPIFINLICVTVIWAYTHSATDAWLLAKLQAITFSERWQWAYQTLMICAKIISYIAASAIALFSSLAIGNVVSVPFNDFLSEKAERLLGSWTDNAPFVFSAWARTMATLVLQEIIRIIIFTFVAIVLFLISFIPGAAFFTMPIGWLFAGYILAFDYLAYPLERRGYINFFDKCRWVHQRLFCAVGYGSFLNIFIVIPFVKFVFIPIGVVGGALLFAELEGDRRA